MNKKLETFVVLENEFEYTGGGCWVLFSTIKLPEEDKIIYASVNDELCCFYDNPEDWRWCENSIQEKWFEDIGDCEVARFLFKEFDRLYEIHKYD